jgi:hypothetical protein
VIFDIISDYIQNNQAQGQSYSPNKHFYIARLLTNGKTDGRMDGWIDRWMDRWIDAWMDG